MLTFMLIHVYTTKNLELAAQTHELVDLSSCFNAYSHYWIAAKVKELDLRHKITDQKSEEITKRLGERENLTMLHHDGQEFHDDL